MLNIAELEKRWLRYKIKSTIPYIIVSIIMIIAFISSFIYGLNSSEKNIQIETKPKNKEINKVEKKDIPQKDNSQDEIKHVDNPKKVLKEKKTILRPSMEFVNDIERKYIYTQQSNKIDKAQYYSKIEPPKEEIVTEEVYLPQEVKLDKQTINIERKNSKNDIKEVLKRFKKSHNPALSLFIAKKYYEQGKYKKSYNYALITNKIDKDIEDSWIIFAKSLVKLGKKDKATKILKSYISYSDSNSAQILLDEIKSGKFQ